MQYHSRNLTDRFFSDYYESSINHQGFILTNKASENKNFFKKTLDLLNPFSDLKVLTNAELEALYGNINSKEKMMNFCNYVNNKGGDLGSFAYDDMVEEFSKACADLKVNEYTKGNT